MKITIEAGKFEELADGVLSVRRCLPPSHSIVFDAGSLFLNGPSTQMRVGAETLVGFRVAGAERQMAAAAGLVNGSSVRRERWPRRAMAVSVEARRPIAIGGVWLAAIAQPSVAGGTILSGPSILRWGQNSVNLKPGGDRAVHILSDGYRGESFPPETVSDDILVRCRLAKHAHWVRVVSPALLPPSHGTGDLQQRRFGIAVVQLSLDGSPIGLKDAALMSGFYPIEGEAPRQWRWTNGSGLIALEPSRSERIFAVRFTNWHEMLES